MSGLSIASTMMAASLALSGCAATGAALAPEQTEAPASAPLTASGPSAPLAPDTDENLVWAASVVKVDFAPNQTDLTAKLFGTAGGDPAMNGLYTYVAFFVGPHEGWRVYKLGDFLDYRILAASPGRIDLELRESTMNAATSEIGSRTRRVIVSWAQGGEDAAPAAVTVTPAQ
jgi:hypothetical protein